MVLAEDAPKRDQPNAVSAEQGTAYSNQQIPQTPHISSEPKLEPSIERDREPKHNQWYRLVWIRLGLEALTLIAVIVYAGFTYNILKETQQSTKAAQKSATQAERAATVAEETLRSIERSSQLDQRAWVGIKSTRLEGQIEQGQKVQAAFVMTNTGKTPGLAVIVTTWVGTKMPPEEILSATGTPKEPLAIPPNGEITFWTELSETDVGQLIEGKGNLYIYGRITYHDVFRDKTRQTQFCRLYNKNTSGRLQFCPSLNDMD